MLNQLIYSSNCMQIVVRTMSIQRHLSAINLYKHLFRECEKLPKDAQEHYKHTIRQSYKQHKFEPDPDRVREIISKAVEDAQWIRNKYNNTAP